MRNLIEAIKEYKRQKLTHKEGKDVLLRADERSKVKLLRNVLPWESCHVSGNFDVAYRKITRLEGRLEFLP